MAAMAVVEMYQNGVSTRKVQKVAEKLGISRLSADQVSAICRSLDEEVAVFAGRTFEGLESPTCSWTPSTSGAGGTTVCRLPPSRR